MIILLALGVPCSAQLTVILVMLGALSPLAMAIWIGVILSSIAFVGRLAHMILPGKTSDFVLELPLISSLRVPVLSLFADHSEAAPRKHPRMQTFDVIRTRR